MANKSMIGGLVKVMNPISNLDDTLIVVPGHGAL